MENKQTYTTQVYGELLEIGTSEFSVDINCPFIPDTIKFSNLKTNCFPPAGTEIDDNIYILSSNLIQSLDNRIGSFCALMSIMLEPVSFQNNRSVNGSYKFTIDEEIDQITALTFTMTFIKN